MSSFSDMLIYLRKREKLSQHELSAKIGISRSAISMYETGKREPDFETLEIFADYFKVNMDTLLGKASDNSEKPAPIAESELDNALIKMLVSLTPSELMQVDAFVQGLIAARKA